MHFRGIFTPRPQCFSSDNAYPRLFSRTALGDGARSGQTGGKNSSFDPLGAIQGWIANFAERAPVEIVRADRIHFRPIVAAESQDGFRQHPASRTGNFHHYIPKRGDAQENNQGQTRKRAGHTAGPRRLLRRGNDPRLTQQVNPWHDICCRGFSGSRQTRPRRGHSRRRSSRRRSGPGQSRDCRCLQPDSHWPP